MTNTNAFCKALLHVAVVIAPLQALASVSSFAELTNFQYSFRDIDTNDGISGSLVFGSGAGLPGGVPVSHALALTTTRGDHQSGTSAFAPVSATSIEFSARAFSNLSGDGSYGGLKLAASGSAEGGTYLARTGAPAPFRLDYDGPIPHAGTPFTLSANTEVTFSALSTIGGSGGWAEATLYTEGDKAQQGGFSSVVASSNMLRVSFANPTTQSVTGWFYARAEAGGNSATPIPEPSTYALMSVGLLVLGLASKRTKPAGSRRS